MEAAAALGVTPRRVRALIEAGRVDARKVGGAWLVEGATLRRAAAASRALAPATAWALLTGDTPPSRTAAVRVRAYLGRLASSEDPERLLVAWAAARGSRVRLQSRTPSQVLADPRVVPSGLSDPRSGITDRAVAEGYVTEEELRSLRLDHLLAPGGHAAPVILHVTQTLPPAPVPLLLLAADLAEHDGPRESARARELIRQALA